MNRNWALTHTHPGSQMPLLCLPGAPMAVLGFGAQGQAVPLGIALQPLTCIEGIIELPAGGPTGFRFFGARHASPSWVHRATQFGVTGAEDFWNRNFRLKAGVPGRRKALSRPSANDRGGRPKRQESPAWTRLTGQTRMRF